MLATLPTDAPRLGTLGGQPRYNSLNYELLAELVAKVTKKSFAQAVRTDLLTSPVCNAPGCRPVRPRPDR